MVTHGIATVFRGNVWYSPSKSVAIHGNATVAHGHAMAMPWSSTVIPLSPMTIPWEFAAICGNCHSNLWSSVQYHGRSWPYHDHPWTRKGNATVIRCNLWQCHDNANSDVVVARDSTTFVHGHDIAMP